MTSTSSKISRLVFIVTSIFVVWSVLIWLNLTVTISQTKAAESNNNLFQTVQSTTTVTYYVHLPVVIVSNGGNTPEPTPNPVVTPPPDSTIIEPAVAAALQSQAGDYPTALAGTGDNLFDLGGTDVISVTPPEQRKYLGHTLIQCNVFGQAYLVNRIYFEFDTTAIPENFSEAYISFENYVAWPGPPLHYVNIWLGNWSELLQPGTNETIPAVWTQYGPMLAHVQGAWNNQAEQVTIKLSRNAVNAGSITKLAFTTSTEGTAPLLYSCMGNNPALGGAFSIPYLYIK